MRSPCEIGPPPWDLKSSPSFVRRFLFFPFCDFPGLIAARLPSYLCRFSTSGPPLVVTLHPAVAPFAPPLRTNDTSPLRDSAFCSTTSLLIVSVTFPYELTEAGTSSHTLRQTPPGGPPAPPFSFSFGAIFSRLFQQYPLFFLFPRPFVKG